MANNNGASPSVNIRIEDASFIATQNNTGTTLGVVGETLKGKAFTPVSVNSYSLYQELFGGLNPCKFPDTNQPIYETSYIAKQYLTESNSLYVTRVLGLSGYDAGDAWYVKMGATYEPTSIVVESTDAFTLDLEYVDGVLQSAVFNDSDLQDFYDLGLIPNTLFGGSSVDVGASAILNNTFYGNCDGTFDGIRFVSSVTNVTEDTICITGNIITSEGIVTTGSVQTCVVVYGAGTITYGSTFIVDVVNPIVLINNDTNGLTTIGTGLLQVNGGTMTHLSDGTIQFEGCTFFLPNGSIISGGNYSICDFAGNDAIYDCNTINGENYTLTTKDVIETINVIVTGESIYTTDIPSGIVRVAIQGTVNKLSATAKTAYENMVLFTLRSYASYNGSEELNFNVRGNTILLEPLVAGDKIQPYDEFKLRGTVNGQAFEYIVSLDRRKQSYIGRVLAKPTGLCCPATVPLYIEEIYQTSFDNLVAQGQVDCIKPSIGYDATMFNFKREYKGAVTPWVVSEIRGNKVFRLFRFHTFSDGNASNNDIKISIENIKPDRKEFDVVVRRYDDLDRRPVVLERFSRVNLSTTSNNYIGLAIGTTDGQFTLNSKYIMIEIAGDCLDDSYPAGFEGYPVRNYNNALAPQMVYQSKYDTLDKIRTTYLGVSDTVGIEQDMFDFKGLMSNGNEWTAVTKGFHMDKDAVNVTVNGMGSAQTFVVGENSFKNETELSGTTYERLQARKFTLAPYGGFDGWDIHRKQRTNTDSYTASANLGVAGTLLGNFTPYVVNDDIIGITSDYYAYLKGILSFENPESVIIDLLATPNVNTLDNSNLVEAAIDMIENDRCDAFYIVSTPDYDASFAALPAADIADSIRDLYDTPYAATYVYWGQYVDTENNTRLFIPPTAEVARIFAFTDKTSAPWFAGAGVNRGLTQFTNIRKKLKQAERDVLAEERINSIYTDRNNHYIWGNRTLQIANTLLTEISIVRMLLYLRRQVNTIGLRLLFEPNDANVANQFSNALNPILADLRSRRGIFNYAINLDRTQSSIDRGELNGVITIYPTPTLREINITFRVTNSGSEISFT